MDVITVIGEILVIFARSEIGVGVVSEIVGGVVSDNATMPLKPSMLTMLSVDGADVPALTAKLDGFTEMAKSGTNADVNEAPWTVSGFGVGEPFAMVTQTLPDTLVVPQDVLLRKPMDMPLGGVAPVTLYVVANSSPVVGVTVLGFPRADVADTSVVLSVSAGEQLPSLETLDRHSVRIVGVPRRTLLVRSTLTGLRMAEFARRITVKPSNPADPLMKTPTVIE